MKSLYKYREKNCQKLTKENERSFKNWPGQILKSAEINSAHLYVFLLGFRDLLT